MKDDGSTKTVKASTFKAQCLRLMDEVAESGEELVITKQGRPVSRLVPYNTVSKLMFGRNRENIHVIGDIVSPMPAEGFHKPGDADQDLF